MKTCVRVAGLMVAINTLFIFTGDFTGILGLWVIINFMPTTIAVWTAVLNWRTSRALRTGVHYVYED